MSRCHLNSALFIYINTCLAEQKRMITNEMVVGLYHMEHKHSLFSSQQMKLWNPAIISKWVELSVCVVEMIHLQFRSWKKNRNKYIEITTFQAPRQTVTSMKYTLPLLQSNSKHKQKTTIRFKQKFDVLIAQLLSTVHIWDTVFQTIKNGKFLETEKYWKRDAKRVAVKL